MFFSKWKILNISIFIFLNLSFIYSATAQSVRFQPPPPPPDETVTSGRQKGGSSRGDCPDAPLPLTALVPATTQHDETLSKDPELNSWQSVWGLTTAQSPTLWFYIPYALAPHQYIEFVLEDESGKNVYKASFTVDQLKSGIVGAKIPPSKTLEFGRKYHWYFLINCDSNSNRWVEGWIQRIALNPTLKNQLIKASPQQQIAIYANNGIWYDALNNLAQLRQKNPQDPILFKEWISLLSSVGLKEIATEPIADCCSPTARKIDLQPISN